MTVPSQGSTIKIYDMYSLRPTQTKCLTTFVMQVNRTRMKHFILLAGQKNGHSSCRTRQCATTYQSQVKKMPHLILLEGHDKTP